MSKQAIYRLDHGIKLPLGSFTIEAVDPGTPPTAAIPPKLTHQSPYDAVANTSETFWPPKPKELDMAWDMLTSRA